MLFRETSRDVLIESLKPRLDLLSCNSSFLHEAVGGGQLASKGAPLLLTNIIQHKPLFPDAYKLVNLFLHLKIDPQRLSIGLCVSIRGLVNRETPAVLH